jgi:hypothetical protein
MKINQINGSKYGYFYGAIFALIFAIFAFTIAVPKTASACDYDYNCGGYDYYGGNYNDYNYYPTNDCYCNNQNYGWNNYSYNHTYGVQTYPIVYQPEVQYAPVPTPTYTYYVNQYPTVGYQTYPQVYNNYNYSASYGTAYGYGSNYYGNNWGSYYRGSYGNNMYYGGGFVKTSGY